MDRSTLLMRSTRVSSVLVMMGCLLLTCHSTVGGSLLSSSSSSSRNSRLVGSLSIRATTTSSSSSSSFTEARNEDEEGLRLLEYSPFPPRELQEGGVPVNGADTNSTAVDDEDHGSNSTAIDTEEEHHDDHVEEDDHDDHEEESTAAADSELAEEEASSTSKPWGEVIVAALLINMITLIGVLFLSGEFVAKRVFHNKDIANSSYYHTFTHNIIPSFACGALLATTVFLVLPEALYMITAHFTPSTSEAAAEAAVADDADHDHRFLQETEVHAEHEEEEEVDADVLAVWRFGTCIICGFLLPILTSALFPHRHGDEDPHHHTSTQQESVVDGAAGIETDHLRKNKEVDEDTEGGEEKPADLQSPKSAVSEESDDISDVVVRKESGTLVPHAIDWSLASSIMAGDFFHNFADGIFVGTAFLNCNRDLAITISAATIYHEIAQEIADYFMLTRFCYIPPWYALGLNFVNGLSVLFGAIIIVGIEDMADVAIGSILAVSAGVYFYISVAECFPRARAAHKTAQDKAMSLIAFIVGVVPIGLVLLNHGHCEEGHEH